MPSPASEQSPSDPHHGRQDVFHIRTAEQWAAMASPVCAEVLEMLRSAAPCSATELSLQMDRPADGLYHHLRRLRRTGFIREIGTRRVGKQVEAVFDLSADAFVFDYDPSTGLNVERAQRVTAGIVRMIGRTVEAGLESPEARLEGEAKNLWSRVDTTWLDDEGLRRLNEHFQAIEQIVLEGNARRQGQLLTLGRFLAPAIRTRRAEVSRVQSQPATGPGTNHEAAAREPEGPAGSYRRRSRLKPR